jgi:PAP2 superfamily
LALFLLNFVQHRTFLVLNKVKVLRRMKPTLHAPTTLLKRSKWVVLALVTTIYSCRDSNNGEPVTPTNPSKSANTFLGDLATKWADLDLKLIRTTAGFTPPVASRALGYVGVSMYESVVAGIDGANSLNDQLNGLKNLPKVEANKEYNWAISFNAAQWYMSQNLWPTTSAANKKTIDSLGTALRDALKMGTDAEVVTRSEAYGEAIAKAIFEWSKTDGGHEGFAKNFPTDYVRPVGAGKWLPTGTQQIPLQPYWGKNRNLIASNRNLPAPAPIPYSTLTTSDQFKQHIEVVNVSKTLTADQRAIALFWADGGNTFTPPGHSFNWATIAIRSTNAKLDKAVEAYARVGIAVADAFVNCWRCKYAFNTMRPITYIRATIDPRWSPLIATPPFPEHTSGHSTQSSATATVLEAMFGNNFAFTDNTNNVFNLPARSFTSFKQAAEEAAVSRLYGGIHIRHGNEQGAAEGGRVGAAVNALKWKK